MLGTHVSPFSNLPYWGRLCDQRASKNKPNSSEVLFWGGQRSTLLQNLLRFHQRCQMFLCLDTVPPSPCTSPALSVGRCISKCSHWRIGTGPHLLGASLPCPDSWAQVLDFPLSHKWSSLTKHFLTFASSVFSWAIPGTAANVFTMQFSEN